jgi:hypothetical protein
MKIKRIAFWLFLFVLSSHSLSSQTLTLPDNTSYPCGNMDFPVVAAGFPSNVGAATIYINLDTNYVSYLGYTPGTLFGALIFFNAEDSRVGVSFSYPPGLDPDGTMFTLHLYYKKGTSIIDFDEDVSEFAEVDFDPIPVTYTDGSAGPMPRTDYYVDAAASPGGDGLSWGTAFQTITAAANAALDRGDHVTIRPGTYNEAIVIKSNGLELLPLTTGVNVTGVNTVTFPSGTDLDCIDPGSYPDEIFLYIYRSLKGNNGIFEVQSIDTATRTLTVKSSSLMAETGAVGDTTRLQASLAHAIVYRKDTANPAPLIVNAGGISGAKAACYIGDPIGAGDDANPANYNIVDGFSLTGIGNLASGRYGLRIQGSMFNAFMNGSIYECDSVAVLIGGNDAHPAKRNIIQNNIIYNTKQKGVKIGQVNASATNNRVHHNLVMNNDIYSTGAGLNKDYVTAVETNQYTSHNVIVKNTIRDLNLKTVNKGAILIGRNSPSNLVNANYLKDISDVLGGANAYIFVRDNSDNTKVFNNVLVKSVAVDDDIYGFRLNALGHAASSTVYNTVYNLDKGVYFEDSGLTDPVFLFRNNILNQLNDTYFTHTLTGGRFEVSNNSYGMVPSQSGGTYYWPDATSVTGDPQFLDPAFFGSPYGFTLQTGSHCFGNGTPVTNLVIDYREDPRDATDPTIGAYENVLSNVSWTGAVSSDWHDYRNWGPEYIPNADLDAVIPFRNNLPNVFNSDASCKSIEIQQGATVNVNTGRTLTIIN